MPKILQERINRAMGLTNVLATDLPSDLLGARIPGVRSNTIGQQFWCVIGARESYCTALREGKWVGFSCSLGVEEIVKPSMVKSTLQASRLAFDQALAAALQIGVTESRMALAIDLLEHEVSHQGQLIRFFYANSLPFPQAFKSRFHLSD